MFMETIFSNSIMGDGLYPHRYVVQFVLQGR